MKKRVLLLITLVVSLFIYSGRVLGNQVMYMECSDSFTDFFAMITKGESNIKLQIGYLKENEPGSGDDKFEFVLADKDNCWITDASKLNDDCSVGENGTEQLFNMNYRLCPQKMRLAKFESPPDIVFAGELVQSAYSNTLENNEYVFFKRKDGMIFAESYYNANGIYSHINNFKFDDEYQKKIIYGVNIKSNGHTNVDCIRNGRKSTCGFNREFWKVAHDYNWTYVYQECEKDDKCNFENDYTVLFDSYSNRTLLNEKVEMWFKDIGNFEFNTNYSSFLNIVNDDNYISAVDSMIDSYEKNGSYNFDDGYTSKEMYNKLKLAYENLKEIYDKPVKFKNYSNTNTYLSDPTESALQYVMKETIGKVTINKYCESNKDYKCLNVSYMNNVLYDDIKAYLNQKAGYSGNLTFLDLGNLNVLDNYTKKFLNAIAYLNKYSDSTDLDENIKKNELPELKRNMASLGEIRDIYIVIDCDDLISEQLQEKIGNYYNFFKILISLSLIAFGLLDFGKAIFESDEKKMNEAKTKFIKRIIVVVILFLIPLFVKFMLTIANAVWGSIYPGACGLF